VSTGRTVPRAAFSCYRPPRLIQYSEASPEHRVAGGGPTIIDWALQAALAASFALHRRVEVIQLGSSDADDGLVQAEFPL
jgi:hypothetical protein